MIDKIDRLRSSDPLNMSSSVKRAGAASTSSSANFAGSVSSSASTGGSVGSLSSAGNILGASSVSVMLGVQELGDALQRASRGKAKAEEILKKLDKIRLSLLCDDLKKSDLESLSQTVAQQKEHIDDPKLSEILDEIDLRAKVELAKYYA